MDTDGKRHGEDAGGGLHEQAHGLEGVSHDVFWLGVRLGLLMQEFDTRHLAAALRHLDAVANDDAPAVDAQRLRKEPQHHLGPQRGEPVELHGRAVKVIDQLVVEARIELQRAHQAGHAEQFGAHGEAGDGGGEPEEGRSRENAGRRRQIAFHQGIHSDIGPARCCF